MESHGWNEEKLMELAMNNPLYKDEICITPLENIILGIPGDDLSSLKNSGSPMAVITNTAKNYGAAAILNKDAMMKIADACEDDLYIIPSSVHECITIPKSVMEPEELREMVCQVNQTQVLPEERLSDDVYFFDSVTREISMADFRKERTERQGPDVSGPQRK